VPKLTSPLVTTEVGAVAGDVALTESVPPKQIVHPSGDGVCIADTRWAFAITTRLLSSVAARDARVVHSLARRRPRSVCRTALRKRSATRPLPTGRRGGSSPRMGDCTDRQPQAGSRLPAW
jgi:hypothetical protein